MRSWLSYILYALVLLSLTACQNARRGEPEYAPVAPQPVAVPQQRHNSIYHSGTAMMFFEDLRARRIGDTLTVLLEEKTDGTKSADTSLDKSTSTEVSDPIILGQSVTWNGDPIFRNSLESEHSFEGEAESSQSNNLSGSITVTVVDVQANGNLVVQGEKWVNINQGEEYIRLRGIVRPIDISSTNHVSSTRVADAQIQYSGKSALADANTIGWLAKFFLSALMPF